MAEDLNGLDINLQGMFNEQITDISRPYLYRVRIPDFIQEEPFNTPTSLLTAWAQSTSLPGYSFQDVNIKLQGQDVRLAGPAVFDGTWNIEFLLDESHTLRHNLIRWMNTAYDGAQMHHRQPGAYKNNVNYANGEASDGHLSVTQVDKRGNPVVTYGFVGAFPIEVGQVELSHDSTDPAKMTVTFSYDYFGAAVGDIDVTLNDGDDGDDQFKGNLPFTL